MMAIKIGLGVVLTVVGLIVLCVIGAALTTPDDEWHGMDDDWGKGE
jgi:hypothetical protein